MNYLILFLSVAVGYLIALVFQNRGIRHMPIILAFSGAFLLSVTLFGILPEVFETPSKELGLFIMCGILLQIVLDFFSKGAEHGHVHLPSKTEFFPWLLFISLSVHAFLEGFPITENSSMLIGVIVHKIPIAIILSLFFIKAGYSQFTIYIFLIIFALMTPLGSWLSTEITMFKAYENEINAVVIGVFLHVSTTILFESSKDHKFNLAKLLAIILAVAIAFML